jgi:hypothetical protein
MNICQQMIQFTNERITGNEQLLKVRNGSLIIATQIFRLVLTSNIQGNRS